MIDPKTYVYKRIASDDTTISLPKIDKKIAKEYRPTIVYIDKNYSDTEILKIVFPDRDIANYEQLTTDDLYDLYYPTGTVYEEYSNFDNLIKNIKSNDYTALDKFSDFSWDWSSLVYRLSLLGKDGATFSAYGIYFNNLEDIIKVMQLGEDYSLSFNEKSIKLLLKIYKDYHHQQEMLRNIPRMEVYDFNDVNTGEHDEFERKE